MNLELRSFDRIKERKLSVESGMKQLGEWLLEVPSQELFDRYLKGKYVYTWLEALTKNETEEQYIAEAKAMLLCISRNYLLQSYTKPQEVEAVRTMIEILTGFPYAPLDIYKELDK